MSRFSKASLFVLALALPSLGWAQAKVAVVNIQEAVLQTDLAQKRLDELNSNADYKADKAEADRLKKEFDGLVSKFQKDAAVMSEEQKVSARQKLSSKQADLEHVAKKLQQWNQGAVQSLAQELGRKIEDAVREVVESEKIDILLPRASVAYLNPEYSITSKVTNKLNQMSAGKKKKK